MLKSFFAEESYEEFLGKVGVGVVLSFFDKEAGLLRCSDEWVRRNDAMQFKPDLVDVRDLEALDPFAYL